MRQLTLNSASEGGTTGPSDVPIESIGEGAQSDTGRDSQQSPFGIPTGWQPYALELLDEIGIPYHQRAYEATEAQSQADSAPRFDAFLTSQIVEHVGRWIENQTNSLTVVVSRHGLLLKGTNLENSRLCEVFIPSREFIWFSVDRVGVCEVHTADLAEALTDLGRDASRDEGIHLSVDDISDSLGPLLLGEQADSFIVDYEGKFEGTSAKQRPTAPVEMPELDWWVEATELSGDAPLSALYEVAKGAEYLRAVPKIRPAETGVHIGDDANAPDVTPGQSDHTDDSAWPVTVDDEWYEYEGTPPASFNPTLFDADHFEHTLKSLNKAQRRRPTTVKITPEQPMMLEQQRGFVTFRTVFAPDLAK